MFNVVVVFTWRQHIGLLHVAQHFCQSILVASEKSHFRFSSWLGYFGILHFNWTLTHEKRGLYNDSSGSIWREICFYICLTVVLWLIEVSRNIAVLNDILFQFKLSKSDVEIAQQIHYVWGGIALEKGQRWFEKIRSGDFNLEDASSSGRPTAIRDDDLKTFLEVHPVREIEEGPGDSKTAITCGLKCLGKEKKLENVVPHD